MKIYIMSGACYSEDGDLTSYARVFKDLESAKAALMEDFVSCTKLEVDDGEEWIDDQAGIAVDGMSWWSNNVNQTNCQIIESGLE